MSARPATPDDLLASPRAVLTPRRVLVGLLGLLAGLAVPRDPLLAPFPALA